jgi:hypothetical protein
LAVFLYLRIEYKELKVRAERSETTSELATIARRGIICLVLPEYKEACIYCRLFAFCDVGINGQMRTVSSSRAKRDHIGACDDSPKGNNLGSPTNF